MTIEVVLVLGRFSCCPMDEIEWWIKQEGWLKVNWNCLFMNAMMNLMVVVVKMN